MFFHIQAPDDDGVYYIKRFITLSHPYYKCSLINDSSLNSAVNKFRHSQQMWHYMCEIDSSNHVPYFAVFWQLFESHSYEC